MPDKIFSDPELVQVYDVFDGARDDLVLYMNIVKEFGAQKILDVGCGTGYFSVMLAEQGYEVAGIDPAAASIDFAKTKPYADQVNWIYGDTAVLPATLSVDMAIMTGNVAHVFVYDEAWLSTLKDIRKTLKPEGYLVFEVRDPFQKAWEGWTKEKTYQRIDIDNIGFVETWTDVTDVNDDLVSFIHTYHFENTGKTTISCSTLKFRTKDEIIQSLSNTGYDVLDIRDAPDRPNLEWVFVTRLCPA
jgi:SAM-dependent methyltransferase